MSKRKQRILSAYASGAFAARAGNRSWQNPYYGTRHEGLRLEWRRGFFSGDKKVVPSKKISTRDWLDSVKRLGRIKDSMYTNTIDEGRGRAKSIRYTQKRRFKAAIRATKKVIACSLTQVEFLALKSKFVKD